MHRGKSVYLSLQRDVNTQERNVLSLRTYFVFLHKTNQYTVIRHTTGFSKEVTHREGRQLPLASASLVKQHRRLSYFWRLSTGLPLFQAQTQIQQAPFIRSAYRLGNGPSVTTFCWDVEVFINMDLHKYVLIIFKEQHRIKK